MHFNLPAPRAQIPQHLLNADSPQSPVSPTSLKKHLTLNQLLICEVSANRPLGIGHPNRPLGTGHPNGTGV